MSLKVKGTIIQDLAKQVRAEKDKNWNDYLEPEDWEYINTGIMASQWYPDDFFYRLALAAFKISGGGSLDASFAYGQLTAKNMAVIYKNMIVQGDPATTIERFIDRRRSFFSTDYKDAEKNRVEKGDGRVTVYTIADLKIRGTETADVLMYSILGTMHELAAVVGGTLVQSNLKKNGDVYELIITWK